MDKYQKWNEQMDNYYDSVSREQLIEDIINSGDEVRDLKKEVPFFKIRKKFCDTFGHLIINKKMLETKECNCCRICGLMWKIK